ncbi:hypothetical protein LCGC14_1745670 [marine sediment metagenome]|uniref:Uncharacterized protein n=1 Tax=marine sediment metagenome TaxID=412755 RepID=A0A0F9H5D4_9ZZZZ
MAKQEEIIDEEAREQHRSDWIKAEYETMGWNKEPLDLAVESLIKEN